MAKVVFVAQGYENLGIEYLSAVLRRGGRHATSLVFDPVLFDEPGAFQVPWLARLLGERERVIGEIVAAGADLVAFNVLSDNHPWACAIAAEVKARCESRIIFGGIHPTSVPAKVMENPDVDFACVGDGEEALVELCDRLDCGGSEPVRNIWERRGGRVVSQTARPAREDLDSLPLPDKDLFYRHSPEFRHGYTIMSSRGCPYACTFCNNNVLRQIYTSRYLRRRSAGHVIDELLWAKATYRPRFVHFLDDVFIRQPDWLIPFLERYKKDVALPFFGFTSPQHVTERVADALADAGCYKVQMGVQTVDEEYRHKVLWRGHSNDHVLRAIRLLQDRGIYVTCDNIVGLPEQGIEEAVDLARFYAEAPANHHEVFWLRYYPATAIVDFAREKGLLGDDDIARIEHSHHATGIARGGDTAALECARELAQVQLLLNLFPHLPLRARRAMVERSWFRRLPAPSPMTITAASRVLNHARWDIWQGRTYRRYAWWGAKRIARGAWASA